MTGRIKHLMEAKKISAAQFADEIGVQRSSLSHILSGRNKPSLDFMLKVKKQYPEIRLDWLLLGEGNMNSGREEKSPIPDEKEEGKVEGQPELDFIPEDKGVMSESDKALYQKVRDKEQAYYTTKNKLLDNTPERVILIFKNGTFTSFVPSQKPSFV